MNGELFGPLFVVIFFAVVLPKLIRELGRAQGAQRDAAATSVEVQSLRKEVEDLQTLRAEVAELREMRTSAGDLSDIRREVADLRSAVVDKLIDLDARLRELESRRQGDACQPTDQAPVRALREQPAAQPNEPAGRARRPF
jgi:Sec-independent protein translocase protein TatA